MLLRSQGLNPYLGFLHSHKDRYESLVCDFQEPFRCRMDRMVVKLINRKVIKKDDFHRTHRGYKLEGAAVGRFLEAFERELSIQLRGDGGTLKQLLVAQVRIFLHWVNGQGELYFYELQKFEKDLCIAVRGLDENHWPGATRVFLAIRIK